MGTLEGRVAIITGASRGIGAAAARAMAAEGAATVLVARSGAPIEALAAELRAGGGAVEAVVADVADPAGMARAVARAREAFGRVDALIANAAVIDPIGPLASADPAAWAQAIDVNLKGVFHGMQAVLPVMRAQGSGTVVTIGSGAASNPLEGWSAYCASKAAVLMLMRCAHLENKGRGIAFFSLSPGTVATDMQRRIKASGINPVSQMDFADHAPPEHPARALVWLCSGAAEAYSGREVSLRDPEVRSAVGL
jgi:NAD(P)-dependent dehydrogenase (short-subunit alcohol dehydrogenase family)